VRREPDSADDLKRKRFLDRINRIYRILCDGFEKKREFFVDIEFDVEFSFRHDVFDSCCAFALRAVPLRQSVSLRSAADLFVCC